MTSIRRGTRSKEIMLIFLLLLVVSCVTTLILYVQLSSSNDGISFLPFSGGTNWVKPVAAQPKATIAYAITVTDCSSSSSSILDGAAVLAYSIHKHSFQNPESGSRYDYKLYAFLHQDAVAYCSETLAHLGYDIKVRPLPVNWTEIRGALKDRVKGGCCGPKEFLKLWAYTLLDHPIATHLDADMLILKPFDVMFDSMLDGPDSPARRQLPAMWTNHTSQLPETIEAYFTRDYGMMIPGLRFVNESAVQGGFLIVRPNLTTFEMYQEILLEGDFRGYWGHSKGVKVGGFYGAAQIQGLCSYFLGHVRPEGSVELNRCLINNMVDSPYANEKGHVGKCREPVKCEDCRLTNLTDVWAVHYTNCHKPWTCYDTNRMPHETRGLCGAFHNEWHVYRHEMEMHWADQSRVHNGTAVHLGSEWKPDKARQAFCNGYGPNRYIPVRYQNKPKMVNMSMK